MMSSKNPNNPTNSSFVQMLLDASECGVPENLVKPLLEYTKNKQNITIVKKVDVKFKKHQYPLHSIEWSRLYNDVEFEFFLTEIEYMILCFFAKNMWTNNLVQVSQNDILDYTSISSKGQINKAIKGLISKGCIAIKHKGNSRQKTVYMVCPAFATVGDENKNLIHYFWELTGTHYGKEEKDTKFSDTHKLWLDLAAESKKHYYRGRNSKDGINFNETKKINAKDVIKNLSSETKNSPPQKEFDMGSVPDEIEEDLPF